MAPILTLLLGDIWPKTDDGTIVGKPAAAAAPRVVFRKLRLEGPLDFVGFMAVVLRVVDIICMSNFMRGTVLL